MSNPDMLEGCRVTAQGKSNMSGGHRHTVYLSDIIPTCRGMSGYWSDIIPTCRGSVGIWSNPNVIPTLLLRRYPDMSGHVGILVQHHPDMSG